MMRKTPSKTRQLLSSLSEHLGEQKHLWIAFGVGMVDLRYRRTLMGGGAEAVHRRLIWDKQKECKELLRALQRQQWIAMRSIGDRVCISLTKKGDALLRKERIRTAPRCIGNECVVTIFDIPERQKFVRESFRRFLKECGFVQLQRSVWVSQCNVFVELCDFIRETKSDEWIKVFRVKEMSR